MVHAPSGLRTAYTRHGPPWRASAAPSRIRCHGMTPHTSPPRAGLMIEFVLASFLAVEAVDEWTLGWEAPCEWAGGTRSW